MRISMIAVLICLSPLICATAMADQVVREPKTKKQSPSKKVKRKGKRSSDKETDGTEAPDRFEANTVIQSQYELNGEHLEVDPD